MAFNDFIVNVQHSMLRVTLNRPEKRNALSLAALDELQAIFTQYANDEQIKVAVITGAGDKSFAAGGDLKEFKAIRNLSDTRNMSERGFKALSAIKQFPVPVVAAINGVALGGGAELATACDFRIAAEHAQIGFIQSKLGIASAWGGAIYLTAIVGPQRAFELVTSARILTALEAKAAGIVDQTCCKNESLEDAVSAFVQPMITTSRMSLIAAKALALEVVNMHSERLRKTEQKYFELCWTSAEHWQLLDASQKR